MLESFKNSNGFSGSWDIIGVLGKPIMELDEQLVQDLLLWRFLHSLINKQEEDTDSWMHAPVNSG